MEDVKRTKEDIIKAGISLFAKKDYSDVSVDNIVEMAGISKGAFYYYFKSKDEFYNELLKTSFENLMNTYEAESKSCRKSEEKLLAFIKSIFICFEKNKELFLIIQKELLKIVAGDKSDFLDYQKKIFELLREILPDKDEITYYYIMGIVRSSFIYHIATSTPLDKISNYCWANIKKII